MDEARVISSRKVIVAEAAHAWPRSYRFGLRISLGIRAGIVKAAVGATGRTHRECERGKP
jgi:hypothetical protein